MKKILGSILTLGVVAAVAVVATNAFFTDEETSTGNTFVAGDLDLTIDNTSYLNGIANADTTWILDDLTDQLFFNFKDLKPGDEGEDTISFHVTNDSWLCAEATLTADDDVTCVDGETPDDANCTLAPGNGDLGGQLNFAFWNDDGDNVLEDDEKVFMSGPATTMLDQTWVLADSSTQNVGGISFNLDGSLIPSNTYYVGKAWCFGALDTSNPVPEGDGVNPTVDSGVDCDGTLLDNSAMTDLVKADLVFTATQARNNPDFLCVTPTPTPTPGG